MEKAFSVLFKTDQCEPGIVLLRWLLSGNEMSGGWCYKINALLYHIHLNINLTNNVNKNKHEIKNGFAVAAMTF